METTEEKIASEVEDEAPLESTPGNEVEVRGPSLSTYALQIRHTHQLLNAAETSFIDRYIELGGLLSAVRAKIPHGQWGDWVKRNCPFGPRQALKYMTAWEYRHEQEANRNLDSDLTLDKLMLLIADARQEQHEPEDMLADEPQPGHEQADGKSIDSQPEHEPAVEDENAQDQASPIPRTPADIELIPPDPGTSPRPADPLPEVSDAVPVPHPQKNTKTFNKPEGDEKRDEGQLERSKFQEFYEPIVAINRLLEDYADRGWSTRQQGKGIIDTFRGFLKRARQIERGRTKPKAKSELKGQLDILDKLDSDECGKTEDQTVQP